MSRIHKLESLYKERLKNYNVDNVSDFIQSIVNADITKGKYARFLIEAFLNDKFLEEDLIGGLNSTVGQAISLFDKHKHKLPVNERSVYALDKETGEALYQSPGDLWNNVKQYQGKLSGKELKKEEQEKIYRETEFVYKDEETGFQIVSPLTKESAQWWGKGTRWCTSAKNDNQFENYTSISPLFILLMPNGDKLQLWKNDDEIQFMDEADNEIKLEYIEQNWNILEPVCSWLNDLQLIPDECFNEEIGKIFMKKNGLNLKYIPDEYRTKEICQLAVQQNGRALCYVPLEYKTEELCKLAIQEDGHSFNFIPKELITLELCKWAIQHNGNAIMYIPLELRTKELCEIAVKNNGNILGYIPEKYRTDELYELAIKNNGEVLGIIPKGLITPELCKLAVQSNGKALWYVPYDYKTKNICELAVKQNGWNLYYVPGKHLNKKLCELAVKNNGLALYHVPDKYKTPELCNLAVQNNGEALQYVPEELRTKELCELAIQQNKEALLYVPNELYNTYKFEKQIYDYQNIYQELKEHFPQKNLSLDIK